MRSLGQSRSNHLETRLQNHYELASFRSFRVSGFRVWGFRLLGFRFWCLGFRDEGFRVWVLGFREGLLA